MSDRDTFGPRLRRERERRGITLETIAVVTKVGVDLWDGLERNDFSRWPSGIFARAFVRDYARAVGLDCDEVVDEFCRLFPVGDRRATRIIKAQAELIGHDAASLDEPALLPPGGDRRASASARSDASRARWMRLTPRIVAAAIDVTCTASVATLAAMLTRTGFWASAGVVALFYYSAAHIAMGTSPGALAVEHLRQRIPDLFTRRAHA
ncbi:MAG TPA: helix-turn-helix transcriptional regulator [Vicinamibacterales bacterium]